MTILKTKFLLLLRRPGGYIVSTIIICLFAYLMGAGQQGKQPIAVASTMKEEATAQTMEELRKLADLDYTLYTEQKARQLVKDGQVDVAIFLQEDAYHLLVAVDFMDTRILQNELTAIYANRLNETALLDAFPKARQAEVASIVAHAKETPAFAIQYKGFGHEEAFKYDSKLHSLFGFTLFMVIYTVANGVNHIVMERRNGIWNRLIVSRIKKWEVYVANLVYTFLSGYFQIVLVFCIFYFFVDVNFYGGFVASLLAIIPYLLCIVALAMFVASITNTPGKFNAAMTVIAVPFAMLGGAYWPLEVVSSKIILALSYISPIKYGLEILKGVTIDESAYTALLQPFSLLVFIAVVLMGIGINVMEKKVEN
ncbi:ABC transporter permease [Lysinibacillus piscis]|uniref:ABC transmembrane type-2 domain-containing protein n=1 Tax=Lysinibacillus piscis TaxID=2518931 RepID=A0ABQ5NQY5_9BACI|nr:ABC transporter permease [Lysinibacillus sp. KH24]GLC90543.1 hypothetical protein LYSBPC_36700 [Lysinibacillus sp. KH24]